METIQVKTVDPISQDLLKSAYRRGIKLSWDRFEKLQPQDGFLRTGLSCPYGCLQGPCRIDPFGRGPDRGFCGLDRDGMASALLLRLALSGALEAMPEGQQGSDSAWAPSLKVAVSRLSKGLGGERISPAEIRKSAAMLDRPSGSPESLVGQALRVALLTVGWLSKGTIPRGRKRSIPLTVGYGLLAQKETNIGICGQPSAEFLQAAGNELDGGLSGSGQLVSLGDFIPVNNGYLPCVCTSGEAELVLSSGKISLLIAGAGADPSMIELCRVLDIPLVFARDARAARGLVQKAAENRKAAQTSDFNPAPSLTEEAEVVTGPSAPEGSFKKGSGRKLALLGGSDHPCHPLGWIPTEMTPALQGKGYGVSSWGDAALWMVKKGLASSKNKSPVQVLDGRQGPLLALRALADSGRMKDLKGICFTGMKNCQDLPVALGMAALGLRVCTAVPLPLWGSEKVRSLLGEKLAALGGSLTHFDHPAQGEELLDWFMK